LTWTCTSAVAAHVISAESAEALGIGTAKLSNLLLARAHAIAGLVCPGARWHAVGVVLTGSNVRANADGTRDIARLARPGASHVAANAIEALTTEAFAASRASNAVLRLANAGHVARLGTRACVGRKVVLARDNRRTRPDATHDVARATSGRAAVRATNTVDAEVAHAFGGIGASLGVVFFAGSGAIAGIYARTPRRIFACLGHINAFADVTGYVARFARIAAGYLATHAVNTEAVQTLTASGAHSAIGLLACTGAIAYRAAGLATREVDGLERIRRDAGCSAHILRALITVDGFVRGIERCDDVPLAVAFDDLTVLARLAIRQIRAHCSEVITADHVDAGACFAEIVNTYALIRCITTYAIAHAVAVLIDAADDVERFVRMIRHASIAQVLRARIVVLRKIRIEVFNENTSNAVTYNALAIADGLRGNRHTHCGERLPAALIDACTLLAIVLWRKEHAFISGDTRHSRRATTTTTGCTAHASRAT
jgi:hypothetical protein